MAAPIDTFTGDIWHLTIDDLLAPLPERIQLGGAGPFVINLSTSSAPIDLPVQSIAGCEHLQLYQFQRLEDRRPRYRLRLGPFATEDEADAVLKKVREIYPCALTATADAEDMRAITNLQAKAPAPQPSAQPSPQQPTPPQPSAKQPSVKQPTPPGPQPTAAPPPQSPRMQQPTSPQPPTLRETAPKQVAQRPAAPPVLVTPSMVSPPVLTAEHSFGVRKPSSKPAASASAPPPLPRQVRELSTPLSSLESTQTVRALTQLELEDDEASRWFVIQLSLAEEAFDPETVPNLDIFSVYRLYSVAGIDQGRIVHALRLGFFSEENAASAVASYLAAFYDKSAVKRVSSAERQRFAERRLEPRKDVGATGKHAVIEITDERFVRERRNGQATGK